MRILVEKMKKLGLLKLELMIGTLLTVVAMAGVPAGVVTVDVALLTNPFVIGAVVVGMLFFGLVGYLLFVRPYLLYRKTPAVQAESDGEFLYLHTKKEAKIPLAALAEASIDVDLPYLLRRELIAELIIHLFSEQYGDLYLEVPGYGKYRMRFVSHVRETADELAGFICEATSTEQPSL